MSGAEPNWDGIHIEGKNYEGEQPPLRLFNYVSPGYFHTAGTRFVAGQDFAWSDIYSLRPVAILSESLARELWGSPSAAIGKRFREFPACRGMKLSGWSRMYARTVSIRPLPQPCTAFDDARSLRAWTSQCKAHRLLRLAEQPSRNADLHQRDATGRLVGEFDPCGGFDQHHAGYLRPIDGAHLVHARHAGYCWNDGGCPGCCGGTGKLFAGVPHCCCRSRRNASSRVIGRDL